MFKRLKQYIDLKIEELVSDKIQTVQDTLNKSIDGKFKKRKEPPKIDYDTITDLVRKANKSKTFWAEIKFSEQGPWLRVNTTPVGEDYDRPKNMVSVKPEEL